MVRCHMITGTAPIDWCITKGQSIYNKYGYINHPRIPRSQYEGLIYITSNSPHSNYISSIMAHIFASCMFNYWQYTLSYRVCTFQHAEVQTGYAISAATHSCFQAALAMLRNTVLLSDQPTIARMTIQTCALLQNL